MYSSIEERKREREREREGKDTTLLDIKGAM